MYLKGLKREKTKGPNEVALDFKDPPEHEIVSKVKLEKITASLVDGYVILKTELEPLSIKNEHIDAFIAAYHNVENQLKQKERQAERLRNEMLDRISESLNLPFTDQLSEDD
ncbi:hypothetical protein [Ottowia sp. VDI28]|uniref:hypothetical protein n=1 Tax=Ottowia sp. VDI28 TaxID=3133968 RepID=UPI003C2FA7AD